MERRNAYVLVAALFAASGTALAADAGSADSAAKPGAASQQPVTAFSTIDKDGNGMLDKSEASGVGGLDFLYTDLNQDGSVSHAEYEVIMRQRQDLADGATGDPGDTDDTSSTPADAAADDGENVEPEEGASDDATAPEAEADTGSSSSETKSSQ